MHLAGYSGFYKIVEEILSGTLESLRKFPINVYSRNIDCKTPRQCTKGNLVLTKIFRKAEKRYLRETFEVESVSEFSLISNSNSTRTTVTESKTRKVSDMKVIEDSFMSLTA